MARRLGVELGEYCHYVGSMHAYVNDIDKMAAYIDEGYHKLAEMPQMPPGNPRDQVLSLLKAEQRMRRGEDFDASSVFEDPYWADLARLLQTFWASGRSDRLDDLASQFAYSSYRAYLEARRTLRRKHGDE